MLLRNLMPICAAVLGIQILLLGFTLPMVVSTGLICALVWWALHSIEKETNQVFKKLSHSLITLIFPALGQQASTSEQYAQQTIKQLLTKLQRLHACRKVLERIPDNAPKEMKLALRDMKNTHREMLQLIEMSETLAQQHKDLEDSIGVTVKALKRAESSQWEEGCLRNVIKEIENKASTQVVR
ncbi:hypothetical protein [Vibrio atypicus]|uniref:hypothetical protein n=1 Tax=Vibrio atypicus TaxID=558271 RepID=UPI00135B41E3|nr:hypothetical protein [Vibrio atypicus]